MNNELQGKMVEILTNIQLATAKASDFAMEQLPELAQSYVMYGQVSSLMYFVATLAAFALATWGTIRLYKWLDADDKPLIVFPWLLVVGIGTVMLSMLQNVLLVWLAPKMWLLIKLTAMVK